MTKSTTARARTLAPRALWQRTAVRHLKRADPVLAGIIARVGPSRFVRPTTGSHLDALVRSIVSQQLSTSAAATIHSRLIALVGVPQPLPHHWLALNDPDLRAAGLSRQKIAYVRDLARHVADGALPMATLHEMEDDAVIEAFANAILALDDSVPTGTYVDMCENLPVVDPTKITVPTIVMRGQWDGIASFEDLAKFFAKLPNPDKQFTVMPGISHASFQQKNIQLVYHILYSFLTQPKPAYRG